MQCVGKSNPTSHGLHYELLSTFYFIVSFFPREVCYPFYLSCHYFGPPTLYSHSLTGLQNLACDVFLQEYIHIYIISVCVSASISQCRPSCLLLNCCLFLLFFLFLLLLWGVWQVISILGSGTYPPLTCTDSNVNTTLACAQLVKKKKMPWLRLYLACLFFYIFIARNKIYFTVFTEVMPFIKSRSTLAKAQSQTTRACKLLLSRSLHEEYEHFPDAVIYNQ